MLFLHRNLLHSRHRWICGYCSLNEKHSIFCFGFLMLNIQAQTWFTTYLLQNLFQRQDCSFLLLWQFLLQYPHYQGHEGMQTCRVPHTNCQTHPVGSRLSAPVATLTSLRHVQGDVMAFLSLPPTTVFCQSALWGHTVRVATAPARGSSRSCWSSSVLSSEKPCRW